VVKNKGERKTMRILVIGGTGIISTGITRLLIERGDEEWLTWEGYHQGLAEGDWKSDRII